MVTLKRISVDDGCASDIRLFELTKKYNIPLVIYLPVEWQRLAYEKGYLPLIYHEVKDLLDNGCELGSHSISHRLLTRIDEAEAIAEIVDSKKILEAMFDTSITKFCPPRGYIGGRLSVIALAHYPEIRLTKSTDLVHIHPDSGSNDNRSWQDAINDETKELWCHGWELDKFNLWDELESWLDENCTA